MKNKLFVSLMLILSTLLIYYQAVHCGFINFDDNGYVYENTYVSSGLNLTSVRWAFTTMEMGNWHPVTWLSYLLDSQLFGADPAAFHVSSIIIHILNTLLLFLLLCRLTGAIWENAFIAALFALHPLHVESVAWIAERKDVLSGFFFFVTLYCYSRYAEKPKPLLYLLTISAFALGLMSKPMLVTLPLILLLLDYWPLGRMRLSGISTGKKRTLLQRVRGIWSNNRNIVTEKIPFILLSALSSAVTIYSQQKSGAVSSLQRVPLFSRFENAAVSYGNYLAKTIWPRRLSVIYPLNDIAPGEALGAVILITGISYLLMRRHRQYPYLLVGWLWFLLSLLPVIGIIQVGVQSMADRYTYLPLLGIFIMIAWGVPELLKSWTYGRSIIAVSSIAIIIFFGVSSSRQIAYWKNSETLFTHALEAAPEGNFMAHNLLGKALVNQGRMEEALVQFNEGGRINPQSQEILYNIGMALSRQGKYAEALASYSEALRIDPRNAQANYNLGTCFYQLGRAEEAMHYLREAITVNPDYDKAHNNLGIILAQQGNIDEAAAHFSSALRTSPFSSQIHYNLGVVLAAQEKLHDAEKHFQEALRISPNYSDALSALEANRRRLRAR